jgi:outer membrane protein assembly factor BamB
MRPSARLAPLTLVALLAASCGGGQSRGSPFDPAWRDDQGAAMTAFARAFRAVRVPAGADVAVGVVGKKALIGVPLDGGPPWKLDHELHGRPALAGSVLVAAGGGEIFAVDARRGKLLWSRPSGGRIRGAGDDGTTTVVSLIPGAGLGSVVLAIARDGSVVRQIEDDAVIGVPAVVGDAVFLPWQGRYLSIYDLLSGEERARAELRDPVSRAFAVGGAVFVGERSATRFDERIALGARGGATTIELPRPAPALAGDPVWMRPGSDWLTREADAGDKVRLYARPAPQGTNVDSGRFVATSFRMARGLDARTGAPVWEHAHEADFLGGAAYRGGFALCDARGEVTFLDAATGAVRGRVALGQPVEACLVQADALAAPSSPGR